MKFLVDAQLPPALARLLASQGHDASHVADVGLATADDSAVWTHACRTGSVIVTKDEDFRDRMLLSKERAGVVLVRVGNCSNQALLLWFAPLLPGLVERLHQGESLIELA